MKLPPGQACRSRRRSTGSAARENPSLTPLPRAPVRWDQLEWLLAARRQQRGLGQVMAAFRLLLDQQLHVGALKGPPSVLHGAFLPMIRRPETAPPRPG